MQRTNRKLSPPELQLVTQKAIRQVFKHGGVFSFEVLHLNHEVRVLLNVSDRFSCTGSFEACNSAITAAFQAETGEVTAP
jgi:hypothetical protein